MLLELRTVSCVRSSCFSYFCVHVVRNREVLTGDVPYAGLTPLQAAIGVVQRCVSNAILNL